MQARFIGKNGSMGLTSGKIYTIRVYFTDYLFVDWGDGACPYTSFENLLRNWKVISIDAQKKETTCEFCERIFDSSEVGWIDNNLITYDRKYDQFDIETAAGDPYDTGILQDVKFCPYCGEKLQFRKGENGV